MSIVKISDLPAADSPVSASDVTPVVQNGVTKKAALSQLGYQPLGTNAVTQTIQDKLQEFVTPQDFGAVGDGVADDTVAVQRAVNYCMTDSTRPKTLLLTGRYLITSTINVPVSISVIAARDNYFKIIGVGSESGFYVTSGITMFSNSDFTGAQSTVALIQFENVSFVAASNTLYAAKVMNGAFIQVLFKSCVFFKVVGMQSNNTNTFSYWFINCYMKAWPSTFFELLYVSANDIIFDGCYFNGTNGTAFPAIRLSIVQGFKCTNNTFESMDGTPIVLRGSRACEISANYFEGCSNIGSTYYVDLNEAGTAEVAGISITGNLFFMFSAQDADPAFFAINWDGILAGSSNGNWCTGRLHKITNAQPGYDLSINGDVESTTGSSAGRAPIRPNRNFGLATANNLVAGGTIANAYEQVVVQGNDALMSMWNITSTGNAADTIGVISSKTTNVSGAAHARIRLLTGATSWPKGQIWFEINPLDGTDPAVATVPIVKIKDTGATNFVPSASAPASPAAGDVYYDSGDNKLKCYNGTSWNDLF